MDRQSFLDNSMPEPNTGCHLWMGRLGSDGYGAVWFDGTERKAHRVAWEIHFGPIPPSDEHAGSMLVCHRCDVRSCVNPDHLFLGVSADNAEDCRRKGRTFWGNQTHCARGHVFDAENTYRTPRGRQCKECIRTNAREYQRRMARRRAAHITAT